MAVAAPTGREVRGAYEDVLGPLAKVAFLEGLEPPARRSALAEAVALVTWDPWRELEEPERPLLAGVELVQLLSAGADHLRFAELPGHLVVASNVGAYAEPIAEHALAVALALAKRLPQNHARLARGVFRAQGPSRWVQGATVAVLGLGGIGRATARRFRALGARVLAVNTTGRTDEPVEFCGTLADLDRVLSQADVIVVCLPLTRATRGLIGRRELALMKPDAILVNVARGAIVDEEALFERLRDYPEFSAGIDTWWEEPRAGAPFRTRFPFFELPNLLGSPHNSPLVPGMEVTAARRAAENVRRFLLGQPLRGLVRREDYEPAPGEGR
ncbi:MAG TPA: 2-hydroxyacid dehydrogenase [Actinomycetota bacterium]|nr:2-hydroxyacid dehydrogenase [Actinomycetota bacterium]